MSRTGQAKRPRYAGPLYAQVADAIRERIIEQEWPPGRPFPNETDLARDYGVSVGTMRKALSVLEDECLIVRHQGRGTFIADPAADGDLLSLATLHINGDPISAQCTLTAVATGAATEEEAGHLQIGGGDGVIRLSRRYQGLERMAAAETLAAVTLAVETVAVETVSVPAERFAGLESEPDLTAPSLFSIYHRKFGVFVASAKENIFVGASRDQGGERVPGNAVSGPCLCVSRVALDAKDVPVEWSLTRILVDDAKLVGSRSRPPRRPPVDAPQSARAGL